MPSDTELTTPKPSPRFRISLPHWIKRIVNAGIVSRDPQVQRCQRFANIAAYALGLDATLHLLTNMAYAFAALLPVNIYNLFVAIVYFSLHRFHRFGDRIVANMMIAVALIGHSYVVFAFGLASDLHIYFTMAGVILFFVGIAHWQNFLILYGLSFLALFFTMTFASDQGFVLPGDNEFRENLAWQAIISAFVLNAVVIAYVLVVLDKAERDLQYEFHRAERLLTSILPTSIAARLKSGSEKKIADRVEKVSVLFLDLVGFTTAAGAAAPEEIVDYLDRLFSRFDALCDEHSVDKIKTIGDSYLAVGGLSGEDANNALAIARLAFDMRDIVASEKLAGHRLQMRIGIHVGPVVAGVIGDRRLAYDVWGDTVNIASRMESSSEPEKIHVTEAYYQMVSDHFEFESLGPRKVRGAGVHRTGFLAQLTSTPSLT